MDILVADIGGTNVRFALSDGVNLAHEAYLKVADYIGPLEAAMAYLAQTGAKPRRAVFAVAGPVTGADFFTLTNHPWHFSVSATAQGLGLQTLELVNDFYAVAVGIPLVPATHKQRLGGGVEGRVGNMGVIGPGTGLGVASLIWDASSARYIPVPCEGGHVTAPAVNDREHAVLGWLRAQRYTHVSAERVCSGKGLVNIYDALRALDGKQDLPDKSPEDIASAGLSGTCPLCREALSLMLGFLGRVAGNLALTVNAQAGVYFAGGILPQLGMNFLANSRLRGEFTGKGRFTAYVDEIPTYIITDPLVALRGLAAIARNT